MICQGVASADSQGWETSQLGSPVTISFLEFYRYDPGGLRRGFEDRKRIKNATRDSHQLI